MRGTLKRQVGLMLAAFLAAPMAMAAETAANSTSAGAKSRPAVAVRSDATGGSVIAWSADGADGAGNGIVARVFNAAGSPLTGEIVVNSVTTGVAGNQVSPGVAVDGLGNFVVVWAGPDGADSGIFASRFLADGTPVAASEVRVNTTTSAVRSAPAVAMASDGRFVVAWESDQSGTFQVYAQWYDAAGAAVGGETALTGVDANGRPAVGMKVDDGETVVAWTRSSAGQKDVFVRRYNATGSPLVVEVRVNTAVAGDQHEPAVSVGTGGEALVVWTGPGTGTDIFAQRFASNGQKRLGEFIVNSTTAGNQSTPSVSVSANGDSVVAWRTDAGSGDIAYRRVRADGSALFIEALANTTIVGDQFEPAVGITRDQRPQFVIAYGSDAVATDDNILFDTFAFGDSTTVLSPSLSTESWAEGVNQTMKWGFTLAPASGLPTFTLELDRDGNFAGGACSVETIVTGEAVGPTSTSATFSYTVPAPPGGCTGPWPAAKVRAIASNATQDESVPFVVSAAPQIVVMRPVEGALAPSVSSEIRWNHNLGSPSVKIDLSRNGGGAPANYTEAIAASAPSAWTTRGNFFWSPTGVCDPALRCKVKVCWTADLSVCDESDPFNITTCPAITVNPATLPDGVPGVAYGPQALTQTGGAGTGTWSVLVGALPTGFTLNPAGSLSGTTAASGTFKFTAKVLDDNLCAGTRAYTFKVCPAITVNPATAPDGAIGVAYSQTFTAIGGAGHTFAISAGALPGGLTLAAGGGLTGTPNATGTFNFTVEATATGGCKGSRAYTVVIRARPVISAVGTVLSYTENQAATPIETVLSLTDADSANIASAAVQIAGNYANGQDVLACPACAGQGIGAVFTPATGLLSLSNTVTIAAYQTALRSVTYVNTSDAPSTLARTITWSATDTDTNTSALVTSTVNVTAVNDAPVLGGVAGGFTYTENDPATAVAPGLTLADVDSPTLLSATVSITANFQSGQDVLSFTNVAMGNIAGVFAGGTMTLTSAGATATRAQWEAALQAVRYSNTSEEPNTSVRTVTFQINDGGAVDNLSNTPSRTITVVSVNDPPTAAAFANLPAQAGIPITYPAGKLSGTDIEAGTTVTIDTTPTGVTNGTVLINANGSFVFTPLPGAAGGTASFQYRVYDNGNPSGGPSPSGGVFSSYATVSFSVAGPAIYFVKSVAVAPGNCTLGAECTLATALTNIGVTTDTRIFISDANSHATSVLLRANGWLVGQGVGTAFDTLFGIGTPGEGILAARPATSLARPTVAVTSGTAVTLNSGNRVLGLNVTNSNGSGITGSAVGTLMLENFDVTATAGSALSLTTSGTVTATGTDNDLTSTTGTALNVNGVTIGGAGMTFKSINSTTASANAAIVLNTTGAGPFSVTGTGAAGTGGTISNKTVDAIVLNTTGGLVTLNQMIIQDIGNMAGVSNTVSGHDGIQGLNVNGGLSLTGTTIRRISDNAIHGGDHTNPALSTVWNGLTLSGVTIEDTNRFHIASRGDANNEGTVRIVGLRGTVNVSNSTLRRGAEFLDLFVTAGTLTMDVTGSVFQNAYREFADVDNSPIASVGNHCIDVVVQGAGAANVTIGDRTLPAEANSFLNCRIGSIRVVNDTGSTGASTFVIARNTFTVNDGSSGRFCNPTCQSADFDFPMGGVLGWNLGTGTVNSVIENNTFTDVTNASGGVGQLTLIAEGGLHQSLVASNSFIRPGNAPMLVQSRNSVSSNMRLQMNNNTVTGGPSLCTTDASCAGGYFTPGLRTLFDTSNGATMALTMNNNEFAVHDSGFDPGETVEVRALTPGGGAVCTNFENNRAAGGYSLEVFAGTMSTVGAGTCPVGAPSASCQTVLGNRNNRGGASNLLTNPPFVRVVNAAVTVTGATCAVPTGGPF